MKSQGNEGGGQNVKLNRKRKDEDEENGHERDDDPSSQKKPRVVWSIDLHRKCVVAVNQLGNEKVVPRRIFDLLNVDGLTRENVASHLKITRSFLENAFFSLSNGEKVHFLATKRRKLQS